MQWRSFFLFSVFLPLSVSAGAASLSASPGIGKLLQRVTKQRKQQHQLQKQTGNEREGRRNQGVIRTGKTYVCDINDEKLRVVSGTRGSMESRSVYLFRGGQAMNKKEVCTILMRSC